MASHKNVSIKNLRWINTKLLRKKIKFKNTLEKVRICDTCRKQFYKFSDIDCESDSEENVLSDSDSSLDSVKLLKFNEALSFFKESPINKRKLQGKQYKNYKKQKICSVIENKVFKSSGENYERVENSSILKRLQEQFATSNDRQMKLKILTIVSHWSYGKIKNKFNGATKHMIEVAKNLVEESGILATPKPKSGKVTSDEDVRKVIDFYNTPEVSRLMPGIKDCVTVRNGILSEKVQKRLVLCNLKEAHVHFKEKHPETKVQFSKFAELRPKYCILAGGSGSHSVCVCCIHQNVILMIDGAGLARLTKGTLNITNYGDCLTRIICNRPTTKCYLRECESCPGCEPFVAELKGIFDENMMDVILYKQWITVDRSNLETIQSTTDDFLDKFSEKLSRLLTHSYIAKEQSSFLNSKRKNLKPGECIVICDFSENYSFVVQDSIQGNNLLVTSIFVYSFYYFLI